MACNSFFSVLDKNHWWLSWYGWYTNGSPAMTKISQTVLFYRLKEKKHSVRNATGLSPLTLPSIFFSCCFTFSCCRFGCWLGCHCCGCRLGCFLCGCRLSSFLWGCRLGSFLWGCRLGSFRCCCRLDSFRCSCRLGSFRCSCRLDSFRCSCRLGSFRCSCRLVSFRCSCRLGSFRCACQVGSFRCGFRLSFCRFGCVWLGSCRCGRWLRFIFILAYATIILFRFLLAALVEVVAAGRSGTLEVEHAKLTTFIIVLVQTESCM